MALKIKGCYTHSPKPTLPYPKPINAFSPPSATPYLHAYAHSHPYSPYRHTHTYKHTQTHIHPWSCLHPHAYENTRVHKHSCIFTHTYKYYFSFLNSLNMHSSRDKVTLDLALKKDIYQLVLSNIIIYFPLVKLYFFYTLHGNLKQNIGLSL